MTGKTAKVSWLRRAVFVFLALTCAGPLAVLLGGELSLARDWRTASRESAGIAPDPAQTKEAVIQVYAARAFGLRGAFGVHTWIATKRENADYFLVHQVIGWRAWSGLPVVVVVADIPDRMWFDHRPEIIADLRGAEAEALIDKITAAGAAYPYRDSYRLWPGPNSNTFTAFVAREVPELGLDLPVTAIGKDFLPNGELIAPAPSGTGYQFSLYGMLGVLVAAREGLEINLFGFSFGVDPLGLAVKLPGIGRIGVPRNPR